MALTFEFKDNRLLLHWEGKLWREVSKPLFLKDLNKFPPNLPWEEFLKSFTALEEKLAKKEAITLLSKRPYLSSALRDKLESKGICAQAAQQAIDYCQEKGYLNDQAEVARLITKEQRKGIGAKAIYFKLKHTKKIDARQLQQELAHTELSEKEALEKWLQKNSRKIARHDPLARKKLLAKLIRRGFSVDLVLNALKEF